MKKNFPFLPFYFLLFTCLSNAQTLAPGAPGKDAQWASAGKQAIGTSASLESKVWFTLQGGAMTEVYYPDVTTANVHLLQFVAVNKKTGKIETERDDAIHKIICPYQERVINKNKILNNSPFISSAPSTLVGDVPSLCFAQIN
ncbi:MAG: hypothetical protein H0X49_18110, partial [Acidobacteria bacterium]|nr:hypothetical protein [Acidobacteriota bacterium]